MLKDWSVFPIKAGNFLKYSLQWRLQHSRCSHMLLPQYIAFYAFTYIYPFSTIWVNFYFNTAIWHYLVTATLIENVLFWLCCLTEAVATDCICCVEVANVNAALMSVVQTRSIGKMLSLLKTRTFLMKNSPRREKCDIRGW